MVGKLYLGVNSAKCPLASVNEKQKKSTEMSKILCTWLQEVCSCCSLTVLPGPAWLLLNYVLQRILLISVCDIQNM